MPRENEISPVKCVLFDFDGTLAQSDEYMMAALNALRRLHGMPPLKSDRPPPGGAGTLLKWAGFGGRELKERKRELWELYEQTDYRRTKLFPGAAELLLQLERHGWAWGVVTNKPKKYFLPIAVGLGWEKNPALVPDSQKPNPGGLLRAVELCGASPKNCAYVGDEPKDAQTALAAGMPFIRAAWDRPQWTDSQQKKAADAPIDGTANTPTDVFRLAKTLIEPRN